MAMGSRMATWAGTGRGWASVRGFDFIIVHESGHEWFGNSVTAADRADMWIQEGWTTYMEVLYVEHHWGKADALKYVNAYRTKVQNRLPILGKRGVNAYPPGGPVLQGGTVPAYSARHRGR